MLSPHLRSIRLICGKREGPGVPVPWERHCPSPKICPAPDTPTFPNSGWLQNPPFPAAPRALPPPPDPAGTSPWPPAPPDTSVASSPPPHSPSPPSAIEDVAPCHDPGPPTPKGRDGGASTKPPGPSPEAGCARRRNRGPAPQRKGPRLGSGGTSPRQPLQRMGREGVGPALFPRPFSCEGFGIFCGAVSVGTNRALSYPLHRVHGACGAGFGGPRARSLLPFAPQVQLGC